MHQTSGRWRYGLALGFVTVAMWGVLPVILKITLQQADSYTVTIVRFLIAAFATGMLLLKKGHQFKVLQLPRFEKGLLGIAIVCLAINFTAYNLGVHFTTPANAQVLILSANIFLALGGIFVFKETFAWNQTVGTIVMVVGFSLFLNDQISHLMANAALFLKGTIFILVAAFTWAIYALAQKQLLRSMASAEIMFWIYLISIFLVLPFGDLSQLARMDGLHFTMLILSGLNTVIAYSAFAEALEHIAASRLSLILPLTPLLTMIWMYFVTLIFPGTVHPESLTLISIGGALLVVTGYIFAAFVWRKSSAADTQP